MAKSFDPRDYLDEIYRYAYARLGSREEAEDVSMEVIQAICRYRSEFSTKQDPTLYLIGVTRRKIADHCRQRNRQRGRDTVSIEGTSVDSITMASAMEPSPLLDSLDHLPDLQRDVIVLKYLCGFSTEEIGKLIGKSTQAANSLLQRSREALTRANPELRPQNDKEGKN